MAVNAPYLQARADSVWIKVKAQPRARRTEIVGVHGDELKIRVAAAPVDSAANEALRVSLAEWLDLPNSAVSLVRGASTTHKIFQATGIDAKSAALRLQPLKTEPRAGIEPAVNLIDPRTSAG